MLINIKIIEIFGILFSSHSLWNLVHILQLECIYVSIVTFQMLNSHMRLVATVLDGAGLYFKLLKVGNAFCGI